jgi:hypothetical protein
MRHADVLVFGALIVLIAPPAVAAAEQTVDWKPSITLSAPKPAFKPYIVDWGARPSAAQPSTPKPSVVCGMTLVPADPAADPKMKAAVPNRGVTFTVQSVPPTICKAQ